MKPFSVLAFIALAVFWIYCWSYAPVSAAVIVPSKALDSVLKAGEEPFPLSSIPSAPAIAYVPSPVVVARANVSVEVPEVDLGKRALEAMEPEQVAEVYYRFIKLDNAKMDDDTALTVALAYAKEEFKYNLPKGLLAAIGYRESRQQPDAISRCDAYGLMQVQVPTGFDAAKRLGRISDNAKSRDWPKYKARLVRMLKDPQCNIELGSNTLHSYLRKSHGNLRVALGEYSHHAKNYSNRIVDRMNEIQSYIMK